MDVTEEELTRMDTLLKDEKYQRNMEDLEIYRNTYADNFLKLK